MGTSRGMSCDFVSSPLLILCYHPNILLDSNMNAIIGDFGLTRKGPGSGDTHNTVSRKIGTKGYSPPEYIRQHLSSEVDIYAFGIVLLEIATGLRVLVHNQKGDKVKHLTEYVQMQSCAGWLENIKDVKAGEENMRWFWELIRMGQLCSSEEKKRPPMSWVLEEFEKIFQEEVSILVNAQICSFSNKPSLPPETLPAVSKLETPKSVKKEIPSAVPCDIYAEMCDISLEEVPPIPLLTALRLEVPDTTSSLSDQRSSITDSHDYL